MSLAGAAEPIHRRWPAAVLGLAVGVLAMTALVMLRGGCVHIVSARPDTPEAADSRVLRDSLGICQVTLPPGWRPAQGGALHADGPEGSSAEIRLGVGAGTWEDDKAAVRRLFDEPPVTVLEDDAHALVLEIGPAAQRGYSVVAVRPGKASYCWVRVRAGSLRVPARLLADFAVIGASVAPLP